VGNDDWVSACVRFRWRIWWWFKDLGLSLLSLFNFRCDCLYGLHEMYNERGRRYLWGYMWNTGYRSVQSEKVDRVRIDAGFRWDMLRPWRRYYSLGRPDWVCRMHDRVKVKSDRTLETFKSNECFLTYSERARRHL
jgi:hypothetical protein